MSINESDLISFLKRTKEALAFNGNNKSSLESVSKIPLTKLECLYVYDFSQKKILFHSGFDQVLGYDPGEINIDFIISKYHQDDAPYVSRVISAAVDQFVELSIPLYTNLLSLTYRIQRKDGSYARNLSKAMVYDLNQKGQVQNVIIKYTDISFTDNSDAVEWEINKDYLDTERMKAMVYGKNLNAFTSRELDVIKYMIGGNTNNDIGERLNISPHTVATHRKNILFKSDCHSVEDLRTYCLNHGINTDA